MKNALYQLSLLQTLRGFFPGKLMRFPETFDSFETDFESEVSLSDNVVLFLALEGVLADSPVEVVDVGVSVNSLIDDGESLPNSLEDEYCVSSAFLVSSDTFFKPLGSIDFLLEVSEVCFLLNEPEECFLLLPEGVLGLLGVPECLVMLLRLVDDIDSVSLDLEVE